jgi:hypothetical protein
MFYVPPAASHEVGWQRSRGHGAIVLVVARDRNGAPTRAGAAWYRAAGQISANSLKLLLNM